MSWDVAVRGTLVLDDAALARWKKQKLKSALAVPKTLPQAKVECATVGAALKTLDPSAAFDELHALLLAKDYAASNAVATLLAPHMKQHMKPAADQNAVFAKEPRWKKFRRGAW